MNSLQVLYLYDNQIEIIQNVGFSPILTYLYLHNNLIKEIPNLPMPNLKKLYLDDNEIQTVSGLTNCVNLEELHVARQRLPSYASLQFQQESLNCINRSLQVLEISGNGIVLLSPFAVLYNLRKLFCQDNKIIDLAEVEVIISLPRLEEANFIGNPCCGQFKYRDTAIGASSDSFQILDELAVPKHQQIAIRGLMAHRRKLGAMSRFQHAINADSGTQSQLQSQMEYGQGSQYGQSSQQDMYDQEQLQQGAYGQQEYSSQIEGQFQNGAEVAQNNANGEAVPDAGGEGYTGYEYKQRE